MKYMLTLVLALAPLTSALAETDWYFLGKDNKSWVYASKEDMSQARYNQAQAKVWMAYIHNPKLTTTKSTKMLIELNCSNRTSKILNVVMYRGDGSNESSTPAYPKDEYIIPGSNIGGVADKVCTR